jgi:hypothetical protein
MTSNHAVPPGFTPPPPPRYVDRKGKVRQPTEHKQAEQRRLPGILSPIAVLFIDEAGRPAVSIY